MDNKGKRKGSRIYSYFVYGIIVILLGFLVYFIINQTRQSYKQITTSEAVQLVQDDIDDGDAEKDIIAASAVARGNQVSLYLVVADNSSGSVKLNYYFAPFILDDYAGVSIESAGSKYTISEALIKEINFNKAKSEYVNYVKEGKVGFDSSEYQENVFLSWLPTIITVGVTVVIAIFLFRMLMTSAGGGSAAALDFTKSKARRIDDSKVKFKDVAGCDEEKAEMMELCDYLKNPKKYTKCGAKLPKGFLLVGPPGTGKTLLAKAVAGEVGVPFFSVSGSDFVEMFVGAGAGRVRDLFKNAKQNAPCVVFIDEIDAVGRQRGAGLGGGNDEREQTLNQLLVELDGFEENSGVIIIAATNRSDVLDPALLRAGRFDRQITVNLPDKAGREAIFKIHARNKKFEENIDFGQLAKRTVGFSGADIANILNEAAILAVRGNRELISMADIDEAVDRRIAGPAKSNKSLIEKERKQIAYHESGHAIIGLTLEHAQKVRKITIIPRGQTGGHVLMGPENDRFLITKSELEAEICGLLGGRSSEEVFFQDVSTGASNDIERATEIARRMVVEWGMSTLGPIQYEKNSGSVFLGRDYTSQKNFSVGVQDEIDKEIKKIIESAHELALKIIKERREDVVLIAETLLEHDTITEEEISYLLEHRKMPEESVSQKDSAGSSNSILKEKAEKALPENEAPVSTEDSKEEVKEEESKE
ncbi:MAG: ATP-dependent zinc metalloprotease FtsH [Bacilli bacterium]|nr:ATP-dependent zinc metalloprotease FtsH [Bacilli bacterium]